MTEKEIKKVIKEAVRANKITTYAMLKQGVNNCTYKRWMDGKGTISLKTMIKLCKICNVKIETN